MSPRNLTVRLQKAAAERRKRFWIDLGERVAATYAAAFLAQLLLSGAGTPQFTDLSVVSKASAAGVVAVITLLKCLAAQYVGAQNTAALLPKQEDTPKPVEA